MNEAVKRETLGNVGLGRIAPLAAFLNVATAALSLFIALVLIGPAALADRQRLVELALHSPAPLIAQDALKFALIVISLVLITVLHRLLSSDNPRLVRVATRFGLLSVTCLLVNATLSLIAISHAARWAETQSTYGARVNLIIGTLAVAAIFINGLWYLLVSWLALKHQRLPKSVCYLGLVIGGLSLVPVLGIVVLFLSIAWSTGLGVALFTGRSSATEKEV